MAFFNLEEIQQMSIQDILIINHCDDVCVQSERQFISLSVYKCDQTFDIPYCLTLFSAEKY